MLRFIIVFTGFLLYLIITLPVVPIGLLIGVFNRRARDIMFLRMVQAAFKWFLWVTGMKLTVIGEENVPKDQAVLYVGNHRSYFDLIVTYSRCPDRTGYVAKKTLRRVPILNMWMSFLYCLFLDRDNIKEGLKTILKGVDYIKSGISICIFPEGTRGREEGKLLPFKEGSFKMAQKAKCPIIPMAITNTAAVWENQSPRMKPSHVIVEYGKPIYMDQLDREEQRHIGSYVQNQIQEMLDKNTKSI